jgi:hypothetical protein
MLRGENMLARSVAPGLQVLPVLRYRLSFARAAQQYVQGTKPETVVAVDLPHSLTNGDWLQAALNALPNPSTLMIHVPPNTMAAPIVANDAASAAVRTAMQTGRKYACVDDMLPTEIPDPGGELQNDECLSGHWAQYFGTVRDASALQILPRAARIAERLKRIAERANSILFICEWRLWPFVAHALEEQIQSEPEPDVQLNCAIVPEDALLLWQTGYLDDVPAVTFAGHTENRFQKLKHFREIVERIHARLADQLQSTLLPASNLLEPALQEFGPELSTKLAHACLAFPKWGMPDLASGDIPQFGLLTANGIQSHKPTFAPPDIFRCNRLYPLSHAETMRFYPPNEAELRRYWGPGPPPLTRSEAAIMLSPDDRWSVGANYRAMALAAEVMREEGRRLEPSAATDLFTPAAWIFCREGDGDHRSLLDSNAAYRRNIQLSDMPEVASTIDASDHQPDVIHTLSATRFVHGNTCLGVNHDLASGIGLIYTGPEYGPERHRIVTESGRAVPRVDPSSDSELQTFALVERNVAFCVKYATNVVLLAHYDGFRMSSKLARYAKRKNVQIIRMPITVLPRYLQIAVQRRIFLSKTMRWHEVGDQIADRMVFWRIPEPDFPMLSY